MILLLDVDGVLNSEQYRDIWIKQNRNKKFKYLLDPQAVTLYKEIITKYQPKVFLVSAWRTDYHALSVLKENDIYIDGSMSENDNRTSYAVNLSCKYPTQNIILLDDDTKSLPKIDKLYLVKTSWKKGLKAKHIKKINKIMKKGF